MTSAGRILTAILISLCFLSCSGGGNTSNPRETVIALFGAMERNDRASVAALLDLPELMKSGSQDYALQSDTARLFTDPKQILDDLVDSGVTKKRWFSYQRVINTTETLGDGIANVEVTFVDKQASKGYLTKFGVHLVNGKWKIFSFNNTPNYSK